MIINSITIMSITAASPDLQLFIDMVDNPQNYVGRAIYLKKIEQIAGREPWPDPFIFENKFYFNEDGKWFESPFIKNGLL